MLLFFKVTYNIKVRALLLSLSCFYILKIIILKGATKEALKPSIYYWPFF